MKRWEKTLGHIQKVRSKNNLNWMAILHIAMKHAPKETSKVLSEIVSRDYEVIDLTATMIEQVRDEDSQP